jgi:hypothetical protein
MGLPLKPSMEKWETPCTDVEELYFHGLVDDGNKLCFSVKDNKDVFEFCFKQFGPYQVADEAHLNLYQSADYGSANRYGQENSWTLIVTNSPWASLFNQGTLEVFLGNYIHYVILTNDGCLDILAPQPPTISVIQLKS